MKIPNFFYPGCLLLLTGISHAAMNLDQVAVPPATQSSWIARDIVQNGVPMQIIQINSGLSVPEVLGFYRSQWADKGGSDGPGYVENQVGEWQTISMFENDQQTVVQIKQGENGATEGFVSLAEIGLPPESNRVTNAFPKMSGSELVSSTKSKDGEKVATTMIYMNGFSTFSNGEFYKVEMVDRGWKMMHAAAGEEATVLLFNKSGQTCEIAISENKGKTVILANILANES